jgi:hypothetical protein
MSHTEICAAALAFPDGVLGMADFVAKVPRLHTRHLTRVTLIEGFTEPIGLRIPTALFAAAAAALQNASVRAFCLSHSSTRVVLRFDAMPQQSDRVTVLMWWVYSQAVGRCCGA